MEWKIISPPTTDSTPDIIETEDCQQWPEINWETGEYSIALKTISKDDSIRYVVSFQLTVDSDGTLRLKK